MTIVVVQCPRGHGALTGLNPPTADGELCTAGVCPSCQGLWIPGEEVQHFFSSEMLIRFAESGLSGSGPQCGRCPHQPFMNCQTFDGIEVDRCPSCFGLWLDAGEMDGLGGGSDRTQDPGHCLFCARPTQVVAEGNEASALCSSCLAGSPLELGHGVSHPFGMGADAGDRTTNTTILGGKVKFFYDEEDEGILFYWQGELADSSVRCTISYENAVSRLFRQVGITDIEVDDSAFDAQFKVVSSTPATTLDWLRSPGVQGALLTVAGEAGCVVYVNRDEVRFLGEQSLRIPVPNPQLEEACELLYRRLRNPVPVDLR